MNYKVIIIVLALTFLLGTITLFYGFGTTFFKILHIIFGEFLSGFFGYFCLGIRPFWLCQSIWVILIVAALSYVVYRLVTKDIYKP